MQFTKDQLLRVYRAIRNLGDVYPDEWYSAAAFAEWVDAHGVDATVARLRELYGAHRIAVMDTPNGPIIRYEPLGPSVQLGISFMPDDSIVVRYYTTQIIAQDGVAFVDYEQTAYNTGIAFKILLVVSGKSSLELRIKGNDAYIREVGEILSRPLEEILLPPHSWGYDDPIGWSVANWSWLRDYIPLMGERVDEAPNAPSGIGQIQDDGDSLYYPAEDGTGWYRIRRTAIPRLMCALGIPCYFEYLTGRGLHPFRPSHK
jgi:hypothetical protein